MKHRSIDIHVPVLARVEGEGALELKIRGQQINELRLRIYEPPRFFEKFLEGRNYYDIPDTVARICGICPVAYQMSAVHAIESIFEVEITPWTHDMRRVMYCGEWLQSHSLHIHMLAAPDYLGFNSVIEMSADYAYEVHRGFRLQSLGNDLISLFGGRSVHPVGVCAGGFHKAPSEEKMALMLARLHDAIRDAEELVKWTASLDLPDDEQDFISVAMRHASEYPLNGGRIVSDRGLDIGIEEYEKYFAEHQVAHSTALHSLLEGLPYLLGPLARINLNRDKLPQAVTSTMDATGITFPSRNMFHSIVARAVEIHYVILQAARLLENYSKPEKPHVKVTAKAGIGFGCSEAPRGLLWHRYELDGMGQVKTARIVPPTSQNQARIEQDLRLSLEHLGLDKDEDVLRLHAEKVIRNYDPCISCATHFLELKVEHHSHTEPVIDETCSLEKDEEKIRVIGIGSPFAEDQLGWKVLEKLRQEYSKQTMED
ncbi:MAG TPA: hypothetical protein ENG96_02360, partial [Gammaproteobacteria bacterium]|nr:hypothetical protein [Gammaproteobacteria bacterium]